MTVYVIVVTPVVKPVTTPDELTVATTGLLLVHVPPVTASVNVIVCPMHRAVAPIIVPADEEFTVTVTGADVATQGPEVTITV